MPSSGAGAALRVEGLSLRGSRGWVYHDVAFRAAAGEVVTLYGPAGSGRTALLLTLSGRMRPTSGHASVDGHQLPRHAAAVRQIAALGPVRGVNDLDPKLTVVEHLAERQLLGARAGRGQRRAEAALTAAGLDAHALSRGRRTRVEALDALSRMRLGVAAALLGAPRLLCVDDVGTELGPRDERSAWQLLRELADTGLTVLASTVNDQLAREHGDQNVPLGGETADAHVEQDPAGYAQPAPAKHADQTDQAEHAGAPRPSTTEEVPPDAGH